MVTRSAMRSVMRASVGSSALGASYSSVSGLVARMTTAPSAARVSQIATLIAGLQNAGIWSKTRGLWVLAAADAQAASLNWISSANTLTPVASPTFTADRGYAGDGVASYLDTGLAPVSAEKNSNYMMVWTRTDVNASQVDFGNARTRIISRSAGNLNTNNCATTSDTVAVANSIGMTVISRGNGTGYSRFRNGVDLTDATQASLAPSTINLYIGARNSAGTADTFSTRQIAAAAYGNQALNSTEQAAYYSLMNTYMTAVGAA